MKLKSLLLLTMIPVVTLSLIVPSYFATQQYTQEIETSVDNDLVTLASNTMDKISRIMHQRIVDINFLTSPNNIVLTGSDFSIDEKVEYLREIERASKVYTSLSIYDKNGIKIGDTRSLNLGVDESQKPFFIHAIEGEIFHDSQPVISESLEQPLIHFSGPLFDDNGDVTGVLVTRFSLTKINDIVKENVIYHKPLEVDLLSESGLIIYSNHNRKSILSDSFEDFEVFQRIKQSGLQNLHVIDQSKNDPDESAEFFIVREEGFSDYLGSNWFLVFEIHQSDLFSEIETINRNFILISGIVLAAAIIASFIIARKISSPLASLKDATNRVAAGDLTTEIHAKGQDEVRDLAKSFNQMIGSLKEVDKKKEEFVTMVSHELKTPLAPINLHVEMLLNEGLLGKLSVDQRKAVKSIYTNVKNLQELISDVLDINKLELEQLKLSKKVINLEDFVDTIIEQLRFYVQEKQITLKKDLRTSEKLYCDQKRIFQVILNLVKNAADFVPEKDGLITIRVEKNKDSMILFTVEDNGPGIPPEKQNELFKKFYQIDTSPTREHEGIGLGLVICKGLVESHGGKIWYDTEYTSGAAFKFTLPQRKEGKTR